MDVIEGSCCVVTVSAERRSFSCSGVILSHRSGLVICNAFPFSRFMKHNIHTPPVASAPPRLPVAPPAAAAAPPAAAAAAAAAAAPPPHPPPSSSSRSWSPDSRFTADLDIRVHHSPARRDVNTHKTTSHVPPPPPPQHKAKVLMLLNCLEFNKALHTLFQESDQWKFHNDGDDSDGVEELIQEARFLSWFAVLQTDFREDGRRSPPNVPCARSSSLRKGSSVVACGSPFGSLCPDLFTNTLSTGIVSNLSGEGNAVILTDARCLPGTEGGGLFVTEGHDHLSSSAHLVGVIVASLCWKGVEWIGLTLVCSVQAILRNLRDVTERMEVDSPLRLELSRLRLHGGASKGLRLLNTASPSSSSPSLRRYPTVCLIDSGQFWGSGVVVAPHLVLTCRHVVNGKKTVTLRFHHEEEEDRIHVCVGDVLFSTQPSSSYDFAVVRLRDSAPEVVEVPVVAESFQPGEEVVVVGYGALGKRCGPSLTGGVLSKAVSWDRRPVMLQTTCAVQAGASGGAVVRKRSGELLGIVSSNTRDCAANVTYPHLNFSIPGSVFQPLLQRFSQSGDVEVFRGLDAADPGLQRVWRLQNPPSKL